MVEHAATMLSTWWAVSCDRMFSRVCSLSLRNSAASAVVRNFDLFFRAIPHSDTWDTAASLDARVHIRNAHLATSEVG